MRPRNAAVFLFIMMAVVSDYGIQVNEQGGVWNLTNKWNRGE